MKAQFNSNACGVFAKGERTSAFLYSDYSIAPHTHDFYEVNIILKGSGTHVIEDSSFSVKVGDVFVIPPMVVHAYTDTDSLDVYHVLLHRDFVLASKREAEAVPGFLQLVEIEPFLRSHCTEAMFLHLSRVKFAQIHEELKFISAGGICDSSGFAPLKEHSVWKLVYTLSYLLFEQLHQKKPSNKNEGSVLHALEYIHKNFAKKITIDDLCRETFLSRSTFLRSFNAICCCTPMRYISKYRCGRALEMMESDGLSKTEIALACGFYDLSHMERSIKNM